MGKKPNRVVRYRIENEKFREQMAQEEGIVALESGILIRELQKGNGLRSPQLKSTVYVHYVGRLIDGTVFDSTEGGLPACFRVDELIVGWQAALLRMHEGDTFRIYIPARYGYGSSKIEGIPAWSTLDFTLTLVKVL